MNTIVLAFIQAASTSSSSTSSSSSTVASWYCWYSLIRSFMLLSACTIQCTKRIKCHKVTTVALSLETYLKHSKGIALRTPLRVFLTTTNLSKFHLIHALSSIPMEKSLTTEHGCELLRHTLEQFLSHRVYDYKLQGMCKTAHTTYVIVISQPIHNYRMLSVSANYCWKVTRVNMFTFLA